ncbi:Glycosyltransferase family GT90 [Gracilaria domingensis]|nr:Glycosyltransferase family GT90 [Gracilaria domingensis]
MFWTGSSREYNSSDSDPSDLSDVEEPRWTRASNRRSARSKNARHYARSRKRSSWFGRFMNASDSSSSSRRRTKKNSKRSRMRFGLCPYSSQGCGMILLAILLTVYLADFFSLLVWDSTGIGYRTDRAGHSSSLAHNVASIRAKEGQSSSKNQNLPKQGHEETRSISSEGRNGDEGVNEEARGLASDQNFDSKLPGEQPEQQSAELPKHPMNRNIIELQVPGGTGVLSLETVKDYYRKLAKAYLETFNGGIHRQMFFDVLRRRTYSLTPPGANKGVQTILFQIIDGRVYMMDPYEVPRNSKPFYRTRINEVIWLLSRLAEEGRIKNTEFLMAIHDCVQTVNKEHTYRGAHYTESNPAFTIVSCNFSNNIPFPMWEGSKHRDGGFSGWDENMKLYAVDDIPWEQKQDRAVFRGGNRPSMYFRNKSDADSHCQDVGRTRLLYLSQQQPDVLDVSVGGTCAGVHTQLQRLEPREHHKFKYILYAEGNCMWADRTRHQVFGPSLMIKQETPCGQFFEPLLRPNTHYLPTDFFFTDTVEKVSWARENDNTAREMVKNANEFGHNFLSLKAIEAYVDVLLQEYTSLLVEPEIKLENGAIDVTNRQV